MKSPILESEAVAEIHICFVTDDLDASLAWFCDAVGQQAPAINHQIDPEIARATLNGKPAVISFRQANVMWHGTRIEFIEPDDSASSWREWLDRHGRSVHHIGFTIREIGAPGDELAKKGHTCIQGGFFPGGRYAFNDTEEQLGTLLELIQMD